GKVEEFEGDLSDYQRWLKDYQRQISVETTNFPTPIKDKKADRQKAAQQRQQLAPLTKQVRKLESVMEQYQIGLDEIEQLLADEGLYKDEKKDRLSKILQQQAELKRQLKDAEERWLQAQENLDNLV
ncbi:ABC transporter ATP-binding protein, partial [bacterium]|nr:ABC transporter ATP-binding protein [bacterium]